VLMQGGRAAEEASSSSGSSSRRRCVAIMLGLLSWGGIGAGRMLGQLLKVGLRQWGAGGEEEKRVLRVGVGFRKGVGTRVSGLGLTRVSGLVVPGRRRHKSGSLQRRFRAVACDAQTAHAGAMKMTAR
jgi:hypothetical protein